MHEPVPGHFSDFAGGLHAPHHLDPQPLHRLAALKIPSRESGGDGPSGFARVSALETANPRLSAQDVVVGGWSKPMRNPFGVMDVPDPDDEEVRQFAGSTTLEESADDENAKPWCSAGNGNQHDMVEGRWSSRWNGGADPTIPGDAANKWKQGQADARITGERVYLLFDWDSGERKGLIDARRVSPQRLVGKYINLSNPAITRPWIGLILNNQRIDGRWTQGRLDFRR